MVVGSSNMMPLADRLPCQDKMCVFCNPRDYPFKINTYGVTQKFVGIEYLYIYKSKMKKSKISSVLQK